MTENTNPALEKVRERKFSEAAAALARGGFIEGRDAGGRDIVEAARYYGASGGEIKEIRKGLTEGLIRETREGRGDKLAHLAKHAVPGVKAFVNGVAHSLGTAAVVAGQGAMLKAWLADAQGNPNEHTPVGLTLTGQCVLNGRPDMVRSLAEAKANLTELDKFRLSPVQYCTDTIKTGLDRCAAVLAEFGHKATKAHGAALQGRMLGEGGAIRAHDPDEGINL